MYVCMTVCMYICSYVCTYVHTHVVSKAIVFCAETLTTYPEMPSIINGGVMHLTGPCFSIEIKKITCIFTDKKGDVTSYALHDGTIVKRVISGITVNKQAVCPMPLFRRLGEHNITVILNSNKSYTGHFNVGMLVAGLL